MARSIAQMITTSIIWLATMLIFVRGIFTMNYNDMPALTFAAFAVGMVAVSAAASTAFVWRSAENATTPIPTSAKVLAKDEWAQV